MGRRGMARVGKMEKERRGKGKQKKGEEGDGLEWIVRRERERGCEFSIIIKLGLV